MVQNIKGSWPNHKLLYPGSSKAECILSQKCGRKHTLTMKSTDQEKKGYQCCSGIERLKGKISGNSICLLNNSLSTHYNQPDRHISISRQWSTLKIKTDKNACG